MVDSIINCDTPNTADVVLIGAPYEHGVSFGTGTSAGPRAIADCLDRQIELFERHTATEPAYAYRIALDMMEGLETLSPPDMVARIADRVAEHQAFTIVLGGSHAVSIGALEGHARHLSADEITVVQIDANLDMRDYDSEYNDDDPSPLAHACVMRRGHEMGYRTCSIGIRAYSIDEHRYAKENGLRVFEWGRGVVPSIGDVIGAIDTERVYLTVDVDGFDPAVTPATGTPVPGGLSWDYGTSLMRALFDAKDVIGADIVEVSP
ncbi:MAG: arginase family protein, partial [Pseudomonadota bacterium]